MQPVACEHGVDLDELSEPGRAEARLGKIDESAPAREVIAHLASLSHGDTSRAGDPTLRKVDIEQLDDVRAVEDLSTEGMGRLVDVDGPDEVDVRREADRRRDGAAIAAGSGGYHPSCGARWDGW